MSTRSTQKIDGHVFDIDGNVIGANLRLERIDVDGEPCLAVRGEDWFGDAPEGQINPADDIQFCIPCSQLPQPGLWTVVGVYADSSEPYPDHPDVQHQRWAEVVEADSATKAVELVRENLQHGDATVVVAACLAGDLQVLA